MRYKRLAKLVPEKCLKGTAAKNDALFNMMAVLPRPKTVVELGTLHGLSAAVLSSFAEKVVTFDAVRSPTAQRLWDRLGLDIDYRVWPGRGKLGQAQPRIRKWIKSQLKHIDFDFAFIDTVHDYENISKDFALVEGCKTVLIHDNFERFPEIMKFCKEIGARRFEKYFGLWTT